MTTPAPRHATVLFAHGSRDPLWRAPIEAVAARMQRTIDAALPGTTTFVHIEPATG